MTDARTEDRPRELGRGLFRWTSRHPAWRPGSKPGSPGEWPERVGSVACLTGDALVLVDPLVPVEDDGLLARLDALARRADRVHVHTTVRWHRRSRDLVVERYGASTSRARGSLPSGVEAIPIPRAGETMAWIPAHRALVPGDRILGDGGGGLRLCPESWLGYLSSGITREELRERLRPLLALPVERVLVSHGEPVLRGGRAALEALLDRGPASRGRVRGGA